MARFTKKDHDLAILAMDAYNRGCGQQVRFRGMQGVQDPSRFLIRSSR